MPERILFVTRGVPSAEYPLLGIFEFDQAQALASEGMDVIYLAVDLRSFRRRRKLGIVRGVRNGVRWYSISVPVGAVPAGLLCRIGKIALRYLYRRVSKEFGRPDIIHAHFPEMGCIASDLSEHENIPLVITEHSSLINAENVNKALLECAMTGYRRADRLIAVSRALSDRIREKTGIESVVIPNMIDVGLFSSCSRRIHEGFRVVTTSNLVSGKRTIVLLQAVAELVRTFPDVYLDVIGDGPMRAELESYTRDNGLENNVTFLGRLPREKIAGIYEIEDCFALVSERETFGVAYVEAMAAGLPVIATRCGGPEDFVNENNGILIDVNDVGQTVSALEKIRREGKSLFDESLIKMTAARFSKENISGELLRLYASLDEKQKG